MSQSLGELLRTVNDGSILCDIESLQDFLFCNKFINASLLKLVSNSLDVPIGINVPLTYWVWPTESKEQR